MTTIQLKESIKKLAHRPGIYIFKDAKNKPLYIGKASNLKNRVSQYLKTDDVRLNKMLSSAKTIRSIKTKTDIEALIMESQLIKKFQPQFNIMMRDDKQYFYVGFTNDIFPKIFLTHQPKPESRSLNYKSQEKNIKILNSRFKIHDSVFVGPFTDGTALKTTLRFLRSVFPYCTCRQLHHNYCLNYHIRKCPGFCCLKDSLERSRRIIDEKRSYISNINAVKKILNGEKNNLIKKFEKEMGQFAKREELRKAIELRDKISNLKRIFENAKIIRDSRFIIHDSKTEKKGKNAIKTLPQILKLKHTPRRIEGYDVSNIQGTHATGSMVTFIHGQPNKNYYRKFKVRRTLPSEASGEGGSGDVQMLAQIIERRFKHKEWPFPDLIIVDGGKGQVNATRAAISKKIPIIALTKNKKHVGEKIYISGRKNPLFLAQLSPIDRNLLLAIDSEAHRFAINYYRKLHRKSVM